VYQFDYRTLQLLSPEQAHTFHAIPWKVEGDGLWILGNEKTRTHIPHLTLILGRRPFVELLSSGELAQLLVQHYPQQSQSSAQQEYSTTEAETSDVVRFVQQIFQAAIDIGASDIHVEKYEELARVRLRWEGQMIERFEIPLDQYDAVVSRLKILSELDIAERRLPQDGRIQLKNNDQSIDIRVSTIPAKYGEKIVMRLLNRSKEHLKLGNLGLTDRERTAYESAIKQPNGIVLITGPTGSGKTTTLYASLNQLNTPDKNLTTIEDPIEYNLTGINQVQVRSDIGLTFDRALRAFLRQDPNIIMVGEIRDEETAQIAIRAALTGHLVLSTLHTNSSRDAITRLVDMGVEPYLLAAATRMIVAQRLVRLLCPHCKKKSDRMISESFQKRHQLHDHYEPVGCPSCFYTGYKGRKAVYELLPITDDIRLAMRKIGDGQISFPSTDLPSLGENLITLTQTGQISIEEALYHYQ